MSLQAFDDLNDGLVEEFGDDAIHTPAGESTGTTVRVIDADPAQLGDIPNGTLLVLFAAEASGFATPPAKGDTITYKESDYRCISIGSDKGRGTFLYLAKK